MDEIELIRRITELKKILKMPLHERFSLLSDGIKGVISQDELQILYSQSNNSIVNQISERNASICKNNTDHYVNRTNSDISITIPRGGLIAPPDEKNKYFGYDDNIHAQDDVHEEQFIFNNYEMDIAKDKFSCVETPVELMAPVYGISRHRILRDGDGISTLIAFGGCPLNCSYCLNPLSKTINSSQKFLSTEKLYNIVKVDNLYFLATNGGITFGGGEPLLYPDFIVEFITKYSQSFWNITIESSLNVPLRNVKKVNSLVNQWIIDVKDLNPKIYKSYTGNNNNLVIENLKYLSCNTDKRKIILRTPAIPCYNSDTDVIGSRDMLRKMGFELFEDITYTTDINKERSKEIDGSTGKVICEVLSFPEKS